MIDHVLRCRNRKSELHGFKSQRLEIAERQRNRNENHVEKRVDIATEIAVIRRLEIAERLRNRNENIEIITAIAMIRLAAISNR